MPEQRPQLHRSELAGWQQAVGALTVASQAFSAVSCTLDLPDVKQQRVYEYMNVNVYRSPPIASESPWPISRSSTSGLGAGSIRCLLDQSSQEHEHTGQLGRAIRNTASPDDDPTLAESGNTTRATCIEPQ